MAKNDDEDYWNSSDKKVITSFEEDEGFGILGVSRQGTARLSQQVRDWEPGGNSELATAGAVKPVEPLLPLHQLISECALKLILEPPSRGVEPISSSVTAPELVGKLILGLPANLHGCRALDEKSQLLACAVKSGDGDAILTVTLFVIQTLSKKHSYQLLRDNPAALAHYRNFLSSRHENTILCNTLQALGNFKATAIINYQLCCQQKSDIKKKINDLNVVARSHFNNDKDEKFIKQHIRLLEFQLENGLEAGLTAQETIVQAASKMSTESLRSLADALHMSERVFQWSCLRAKAALQAWSDVHAIFQTKTWLGGQKFRTVLPMAKVAMELHKAKAPSSEVNKYVQRVEDLLERRTLEATLATSW